MFTIQLGPVRVVAGARSGGHSHGAYASLNLADYVGDDPTSVQKNRAALQDHLGAQELAWLRAEHGNKVVRVAGGGEFGPADALVTDRLGLGIMALSADCATAVIVAPDEIAVLHCGWRGLVAGIVPATLAELRGPRLALLGPSICAACYEVPSERVAEVGAKVPAAVHDDRHLDIAAGVRAQLGNLEIDIIPGCTFHDDGWFSYRRAAGGPTGRGGLAAVITDA